MKKLKTTGKKKTNKLTSDDIVAIKSFFLYLKFIVKDGACPLPKWYIKVAKNISLDDRIKISKDLDKQLK